MGESLITKTDGYLLAKLAAIGTKSEGPAYSLELWDYKEIPVAKKVAKWKEEPELHRRLGHKVTIIGEYSDGQIHFESVADYQRVRAAQGHGLNLSLKIPGLDADGTFWVNAMPSTSPVVQQMTLELWVEWPYRSIWQDECPTTETSKVTITQNGRKIWSSSDGMVFAAVETPVSIPGGDPRLFAAHRWTFEPKSLSEGEYEAEAVFLASGGRVKRSFKVRQAQ